MPDEPDNPRQRLSLRRHRMRGGDFKRAYAEGNRAKSTLMTVVVRENGTDERRLGLSVGKRCWKSAVKRNRVRRVFREAFRLAQPELPPGIDVVLVSSTPQIRPSLAEAQEQMQMLVAKALRRYREKIGRSEKAVE
jgi:ribonuclease P protein component